MERKFDRKLVLEDGSEYYGYGFGGNSERVCELVFNRKYLYTASVAGSLFICIYSI